MTWVTPDPTDIPDGWWNYRAGFWGFYSDTLATWLRFATSPTGRGIPVANNNGDINLGWIPPHSNYGFLTTDGTPLDVAWKTCTTEGLVGRQSGDFVAFQASAQDRWFGREVSGSIGFKTTEMLANSLTVGGGLAGTAFPTSPPDGRIFYRTDHDMLYVYNSSWTSWLSVAEWTIHGGYNDNYGPDYDWLQYGFSNVTNAANKYSASNVGINFPWDVKPVWMSANVQGSSTCTFTVRNEGANVSGAVLTYTAQTGKRAADFMTGSATATIGLGNNISLRVDTGTANGGHTVNAAFRRVAT